jgi:hypothetical protein
MRNALFSLIAFAAMTVAAQPRPEPNLDACKLMSREEMQVCTITKAGDATGARSARCDELPQNVIEQCLEQARTDQAAPASGGATAPQPPQAGASKEAPPEKK